MVVETILLSLLGGAFVTMVAVLISNAVKEKRAQKDTLTKIDEGHKRTMTLMDKLNSQARDLAASTYDLHKDLSNFNKGNKAPENEKLMSVYIDGKVINNVREITFNTYRSTNQMRLYLADDGYEEVDFSQVKVFESVVED